MRSEYGSIVGIFLVMIGTIFSLWSILSTKTEDVGTAWKEDHKQDDFRKDKRKVIIGTILIIVGSMFQISGLECFDNIKNKIILANKGGYITFFISMIIFIGISYMIFEDSNRAKPIFNHRSKRKSFEVTLYSVGVFWLISALLLMILVTYKEPLFNRLLENCGQKDILIESGLCFAVSLVIIGFLIRFLYYIFCKITPVYNYYK